MNWFYLSADGTTIHLFTTLTQALNHKTPHDKMIMHTIDYKSFTKHLRSVQIIKH